MSYYEVRMCDHAHRCDYGKQNAGGQCAYGRPESTRKSTKPMRGHCITVNAVITTIPFDRDSKSKNPNVSFRINKLVESLDRW